MRYKQWDKQSDINGKTALELIGEEQMQNDDVFIIFTDTADKFFSLESVATVKTSYKLTGDTWEDIAKAYIAYKATEVIPLTPEQQIVALQSTIASQGSALDEAQAAINFLVMGGTQ